MEKGKFCPNCGFVIMADWKSCANCNQLLISDDFTSCKRCYQIIRSKRPNFCPYCRYQLEKKIKIEGAEKVSSFEEPEVLEVDDNVDKITRETIRELLRFKLEPMHVVSGNRGKLADYAHFSIWTAGIAAALTFLLIGTIFRAGTLTNGIRTFIIISVVVPASMYGIGFFTLQLLKILGHNTEMRNWNNMFAAYLPLFLAKDVLSLIATIYVRIFGGYLDSGLAYGIYITLTSVLYLFILLQFTVLVKNWSGTSGLISFLLMCFVFYFAGTFATYYVAVMLNDILEVIIWNVL